LTNKNNDNKGWPIKVDSHGIDKLKEKKMDVDTAKVNIIRIKYGGKDSKMM
jgi:hypothetical protein